MKDIWDKYSQELTTTAILYEQSHQVKKLFPCFTLRYLAPYKKRGFYYDFGQFKASTFSLNDIFEDESLSLVKNSSLFEIREINSLLHGKCYSLCPLTLMALNENIQLQIKNEQNFEILVYNRDEEFWLILPRFPLGIGSSRIEAKNSDHMVSADVKVIHN
jgi:hypothetical protein